MNVCLGGTFDPLHKGHKLLLDTAVDITCEDTLFIGLTAERYAEEKRGGADIRPYADREAALREYLAPSGVRLTIVPIESRYGIADSDDRLEAIVVSKETFPFALEINGSREDNGLRRLTIFVVDLVKNDDGTVISGTLIRRGAMDAEGRTEGVQ